jgi:hypothetical protein
MKTAPVFAVLALRFPQHSISVQNSESRASARQAAGRMKSIAACHSGVQIRSFREHTRDNPFSKQYMWGAVAALGPYEARNLAIYFATIAPKAANDGDKDLAARGRFIWREFRKPTLCPAMPVMARTPRA